MPAPSLKVADGQLDGGVVTVELVDLGDIAIDVGEEPEVAPVGPQAALGRAREPGATHDQASAA